MKGGGMSSHFSFLINNPLKQYMRMKSKME